LGVFRGDTVWLRGRNRYRTLPDVWFLLVYQLRRPTADGKAELLLTPVELLSRLAALISPPRLHKHRYCGVLAPRAKLRRAVVASAGPAGATLQWLEEAASKMDLPAAEDDDGSPGRIKAAVSRGWAMLLARIYECLPLLCRTCGKPIKIIAFILDPPVIERILSHIGEPVEPPRILPARGPPQAELDFDQDTAQDPWPEMDQTAGGADDRRQ
jgi:hypothetical protein